MAANLSTLGTLSYNGIVFGVYTGSSVNIRPVYDAAGRTVVHNLYSFDIKTILSGSPTDSQVTLARRALTKPGQQLIFKDRGLGAVNVNVNSVKDVAWGPKPQELSFRYIGAKNACEMRFRLEVAIPDCTAARYQFAPAEFTYDVSYDIDCDGWTTVHYSGTLRIPATRVGATRAVPDSADNYREMVEPKAIEGFRPVPGTFRLSADRTTLQFDYTFEEMGLNCPPPGIVEIKASFDQSTTGMAWVMWVANLKASYTLAKTTDRGTASKHFLKLAAHYLDRAREAITPDPKTGAKGWPLPISFHVSEPEIYGKPRAEFTISWKLVSDLPNILANTGMWEPVPDSDWRKWALSMQDVLGVRGVADLEFVVGQDEIVDLCGGKVKPPTSAKRPIAEMTGRGDMAELFSCPPPALSWLDYRSWIQVEADQGVAEMRAIPTKDIEPKTAELRGGQLIGPKGQVNPNKLSTIQPDEPGLIAGYLASKDVPKLETEQRAAPLVVVYLCGWAMRACYPIPVPSITKVAGKRVIPANRLDRGEGFYGPAIAGNTGAGPLYYARWKLRYLLEEVPKADLPVPPNPVL